MAVKGTQNPITLILEEAAELVVGVEAQLYEEYGIPLFTEEPGRAGPKFPDDPESLSPETMQQLVNAHGEETVTNWLMERAMANAAAAAENEEVW